MKEEAQRIAIAEACPNVIKFEYGIWKWRHTNGTWCACLWGDPLSDLNAMHEAEKVLTRSQKARMKSVLWAVAMQANKETLVEGRFYSADDAGLDSFFSTATQRAEAFLKTLDL